MGERGRQACSLLCAISLIAFGGLDAPGDLDDHEGKAEWGLLSAGFVLTRPVERAPFWSADLLPERILTFSDCLAKFLPGTWALRWVEAEPAERKASAQAFGFNSQELERLLDWTTEAQNDGRFLWPNVFGSLEAARAFLREFNPPVPDLFLLGLGLPEDRREAALAEQAPPPGGGPSGIYELLQEPKPLPEGGTFLGWEILGTELFGGQFHSWLCSGLEKVVYERLGGRPNLRSPP